MKSKGRGGESQRETALSLVNNLIERLRRTPPDAEGPHRVAISAPNYPRILLKQPEANLFQNAMSALKSAFAATDGRVSLSDKTIETELKATVLRALASAEAPDSDEQFRKQAATEVDQLAGRLSKPPVEWTVYIPLWAPLVGRPTKFGRTTFVRTSSAEIKSLLESRPGRGSQHAASTLADAFHSRTAAKVTVLAKDGEAARALGLSEVRRTVDVLDFFGPTVEASYLSDLTSFEAVEVGATSAVIALAGNRMSWTAVNSFVRPLQLEGSSNFSRSQLAAHKLLSAGDLPKLKARVLNALVWAGRANVQRREDQAFMMRMIALESALTASYDRAGTTDRLRLRVVQILGGTSVQRKKTYELAGELYKVRSGIVHSGGSAHLTDHNISSLKELVENTLEALLTKRPFSAMTEERAFDAWFEVQVLMGTRRGAP